MSQTASPADIMAVSNIIKKVYVSDKITSQQYEDALLYSKIKKTTDYHDSVGDKAVGFVKTGRNANPSARSLNGGTLGAADHQKTNKWELDYAANYIQVKILGTTIAKMATARQAAVRAITLEIDGAVTDLTKDLQRQLYGAGNSKIAICDTTSSSTTLNLLKTTTATQQASNDVLVRGWLSAGRYIDIGTLADPVAQTSDNKITAVTLSETAPTVTLTSAVSATQSTHFVFAAGNAAASSVSYETNGLGNLVAATGSVQGIDQSTTPEWASTVVTASAALGRSHMQQAYRGVRQYGGKLNSIWTSLEHQEDYYNLLQSQVRFASDSTLASGDVEGPLFNKLPVVADPDCPRQVMYFLDTDSMFMASAGPIAWQNVNSGGDVLSWVQGEDSFVARAAVYENVGIERRRSFAKISALTVNS